MDMRPSDWCQVIFLAFVGFLVILTLASCGDGTVGLDGGIPPPPETGRCGPGLASEDLAGQCRNIPATMGALEVDGGY